MNKEEQYLLFALSAPMEILNQGCKPAHDSPKMYTGIKEFDLSSSWGINNRDDLIQTIYQMTDDGHANDLAGLYLTWHRSSPEEWKALIAGGSERGLIYTQFVAQTAMCCGEGGIKAWDYEDVHCNPDTIHAGGDGGHSFQSCCTHGAGTNPIAHFCHSWRDYGAERGICWADCVYRSKPDWCCVYRCSCSSGWTDQLYDYAPQRNVKSR